MASMSPGPQRQAEPRGRRADDWKTASNVRLSRRWLTEIATRLGYEGDDVVAVRMNQGEAVVTVIRNGEPLSVRHQWADPE